MPAKPKAKASKKVIKVQPKPKPRATNLWYRQLPLPLWAASLLLFGGVTLGVLTLTLNLSLPEAMNRTVRVLGEDDQSSPIPEPLTDDSSGLEESEDEVAGSPEPTDEAEVPEIEVQEPQETAKPTAKPETPKPTAKPSKSPWPTKNPAAKPPETKSLKEKLVPAKVETKTQESTKPIEKSVTNLKPKIESSPNPESSIDISKVELQSEGTGTFLKHNGFSAKSEYPLSINTATKSLIVTTPSGNKVVTVLPDQAVEAILQNGVKIATDSAAFASNDGNGELNLNFKDNKLVYEVKARKLSRLLGLIPLEFETKAEVPAETGEFTKNEVVGIFARFLEKLSF